MKEEKTIRNVSEREFNMITKDVSMKQIDETPFTNPMLKLLLTLVLAEAMADLHNKLFD